MRSPVTGVIKPGDLFMLDNMHGTPPSEIEVLDLPPHRSDPAITCVRYRYVGHGKTEGLMEENHFRKECVRASGFDRFGDRMKYYESMTTASRLDQHQPIYARIDGRAFSTFTRGMQKPFDPWLTGAMQETCLTLVDKTHAKIGYVQSDEINLIWLADSPESHVLFSGKLLKLTSVLASLAAAKFMTMAERAGLGHLLPHFDCRVFNLPTKVEAANALLWRWMDSKKNGIMSIAQSQFPQRELQGVDQTRALEMLAERGITPQRFDKANMEGTFYRRQVVKRRLSEFEMSLIPEKHRPDGVVTRTDCQRLHIPDFRQVSNRVGVIFDGEMPRLNEAV